MKKSLEFVRMCLDLMGPENGISSQIELMRQAMRLPEGSHTEVVSEFDFTADEFDLATKLAQVDDLGSDFHYPNLGAIVRINELGRKKEMFESPSSFLGSTPDIPGHYQRVQSATHVQKEIVRKLKAAFDQIRDLDAGVITEEEVILVPLIGTFIAGFKAQEQYEYASESDYYKVILRTPGHLDDYLFFKKHKADKGEQDGMEEVKEVSTEEDAERSGRYITDKVAMLEGVDTVFGQSSEGVAIQEENGFLEEEASIIEEEEPLPEYIGDLGPIEHDLLRAFYAVDTTGESYEYETWYEAFKAVYTQRGYNRFGVNLQERARGIAERAREKLTLAIRFPLDDLPPRFKGFMTDVRMSEPFHTLTRHEFMAISEFLETGQRVLSLENVLSKRTAERELPY